MAVNVTVPNSGWFGLVTLIGIAVAPCRLAFCAKALAVAMFNSLCVRVLNFRSVDLEMRWRRVNQI